MEMNVKTMRDSVENCNNFLLLLLLLKKKHRQILGLQSQTENSGTYTIKVEENS